VATSPTATDATAKGWLWSPSEAETVRLIFELAGLGELGSSIARSLNEKGITRRNGHPWTQRQVSATLARSAFYREGKLRYGDVTGRKNGHALLEHPASRG
jgi:hypothetical protein